MAMPLHTTIISRQRGIETLVAVTNGRLACPLIPSLITSAEAGAFPNGCKLDSRTRRWTSVLSAHSLLARIIEPADRRGSDCKWANRTEGVKETRVPYTPLKPHPATKRRLIIGQTSYLDHEKQPSTEKYVRLFPNGPFEGGGAYQLGCCMRGSQATKLSPSRSFAIHRAKDFLSIGLRRYRRVLVEWLSEQRGMQTVTSASIFHRGSKDVVACGQH